MKPVGINKENTGKGRFQRRGKAQVPGNIKRLSSCKRRSCPVADVGSKLRCKGTDVGRVHDPGMANKENELMSSAEVQAYHCHDRRLIPVTSAEASKMEGASSKYSDITELSKDHEAMSHILFERNLRLKVALTLWQKNASELVAYVTRIQDTGVLLDCLPVLTKNLQTEESCLSLGCCVDLMPQLRLILASKYEQHLLVGLHWVQSIIRKWWTELSKNEKQLQDSCSEERNVGVMRQQLKDLWKDGARLCSVPGSTGELAKTVQDSLSQLP